MPKRLFIIAIVLLTFACTGCHHETESQELSVLPSLHVTMTPLQLKSVLANRDNKVPAYALLTDAQGDTLFEGDLSYFKTRGNTSIKENKKPFAIKFFKKQSFLGLDRAKSFILLANACDESHIRNAIAFDLARAMGIPAPRYAYLTLYVNDTYWGLYQITNKVDVGEDALNITNLDKQNEWVNNKPLEEYEWYGLGRRRQTILRKGVLLDHDPDDITGGYLLDISGPLPPYQRSLSGFLSNADDNIRLLSPKYASPRELDYIAALYNEMESAVHAPDGICPETGRHYSEYLDMESFARYYLLNELLLNWDGGWSSFYIYKDTDAIDPKFHAGPVWDFDRSLDNSRFQNKLVISPNVLFVCEKCGKHGFVSSGGFLYYLCQHKDFQQSVRDCYLNGIGEACHNYLEASPFDTLVALLSHEADLDNVQYETRISADYASATKRVTGFLRERIAFFDWWYDSSMEEGAVTVRYMHSGRDLVFCYRLGEAVNAPQVTKTVYNHDPIYTLYYPGTDSVVPDGTVFHAPQKLELRKREPTNKEVQMRRIKKKLRKIGIDL